MSLLLDALKKSEAERRRGTSPTIDLTRTLSSGSPRRAASRWLPAVLAGVLLVAAAPWLWPHVSEWFEGGRDDGDSEALTEVTDAPGTAASETQPGKKAVVEPPAEQPTPAPVPGAASPRRVAAFDVSSAVADETDQTPERFNKDSDKPSSGRVGSSDAVPHLPDGGAEEGPGNASTEPETASVVSSGDPRPSMQEQRRMAKVRQQRQQPAQVSTSSASPAEPERQANKPTENFIRPWELPQAQRAEFPELKLTVHFYAERAADRFVRINGERYGEGQRVGPGTRLAEIRPRGAVVEFGSYRVLIE